VQRRLASSLVLTALVATACGLSRRDHAHLDGGTGGAGGAVAADAAGAPPDTSGGAPTRPMTVSEYCLAQAELYCSLAERCCNDLGLPVDAGPCNDERAERCAGMEDPLGFDGVAAGDCIQKLSASWQSCNRRADDPLARAATAACERVVPKDLGVLGETCGSDGCEQAADRTVYCDNRSDGVGTFRCTAGGKPSGSGQACGVQTRCKDALVCIDATCAPRLEDGAVCSRPEHCASGYCCAAPDCPSGPTCIAAGVPFEARNECARLATLPFAIRTGHAASTTVLAVDGSRVYWNEGLALWRSGLDGSNAATFATVPAPQDHPRYYPVALAFDAGYVYFLNRDALGRVARTTNAVDAVSLSTDAASFFGTDLALAGGFLYASDSGCSHVVRALPDLTELVSLEVPGAASNAGYLTSDDAHVYCLSSDAIYTLAHDAATAEKLASLAAWGGPALVRDGSLFWTNVNHVSDGPDDHALLATPVSGGPITSLGTYDGLAAGLVWDEARQLFFVASRTAIRPFALDGAQQDFVFQGIEPIVTFAASENDLYFVTATGVLRIAKDARMTDRP
jgi:hypothetical protein